MNIISAAWQIAEFILGGLDKDELEAVYRLSVVSTCRPVKSRTYNPLEFRAEERNSVAMLRVLIFVVSLGSCVAGDVSAPGRPRDRKPRSEAARDVRESSPSIA